MSATIVTMPLDRTGLRRLKAPALTLILTAFAAMVVGSIFGPAQALNYANINSGCRFADGGLAHVGPPGRPAGAAQPHFRSTRPSPTL
ncbi:hypothetical protein [Acidiphilium iwatense]|uniref:Uncharacterized protein n=1 Tax=Acidiphilium iwatense TaxID=768198 RepID=A0ABS9E324_9PROT|nr:hypothetical protein [Acidiphilium iwatense]MCF3948785.1 hypothetical protein [Acidiphilium iwatense]